jgi:uncharacterized damage-inducible protein DinB
MAGPLVQALISHLDSVFERPNGDYPAVLEALAGISAEQALGKPTPHYNSIWQIVDHLTASKDWPIDLLKTGSANSPVWIDPRGDDAEWLAVIGRLKDAHARLKLALGSLTDDGLLRSPASDPKQTSLEQILSCASAHESHHGGQIVYLKALYS